MLRAALPCLALLLISAPARADDCQEMAARTRTEMSAELRRTDSMIYDLKIPGLLTGYVACLSEYPYTANVNVTAAPDVEERVFVPALEKLALIWLKLRAADVEEHVRRCLQQASAGSGLVQSAKMRVSCTPADPPVRLGIAIRPPRR